MSCLKGIDMMGKEFKFKIDGEKAFNTQLGGIITIFKLFAFLILVWYFGQDIYLREQPSLLIMNTMEDEYPKRYVDSKAFNFAIRIEDSYANSVNDPSIFTFDLIYQELEAGENGVFKAPKTTIIDMEDCSIKHFDNETLYFYKLYNYKCVVTNYTIGGSWGASFVKVPQFFIRRCSNITEQKYNIKCKTNAEIKQLYPNLYFDTYIQKNLVNPSHYAHPIQQTFEYSYKEIQLGNKNTIKEKVIYSDSKLNTDTGFIFEDISTINFLEYESMDITESPYQLDLGPSVASVEFYVSRNVRLYSRAYKKISRVLAEVGGIMSIASIFLDVVFEYYLMNEYTCFLQEKLLSLNKNIKENYNKPENFIIIDNIDKDIKNIVCYDNSKDNNASNLELQAISSVKKRSLRLKNKENKDVILNKEISKIIDFKKQDLEPVHILPSERCYYNCCYNTKKLGKNDLKSLKFKLLTVYQRELDKRLEILELMKMKDQFKMIKKIVLNENQCFMLQNRDLHKIIDCKIISDEDKLLDNQKYEQLNKEKLIQYLKLKKEKNNISSIDVLLYKYMSLDLKSEISNIVNIED